MENPLFPPLEHVGSRRSVEQVSETLCPCGGSYNGEVINRWIKVHEIERTLITASGATAAADTPSASRARLGGISFLHRFGSALNHHVHLHVCATDGVFMPAVAGAGCDASPALLPARPITQADLAALTDTKPPTGSGDAAAGSPPGRGRASSSNSRRLSF